MIIVDYSQIALSNIIVQKIDDKDIIRHMILNSLRMYNKKYRAEYGQMVLACDGFNTWRKDFFPEYKAARKKNRSASDLDWTSIFESLNEVREEIKANLPWKVIHMDGCEADDIIGTLAHQTQEFGQHEPVMIISSDKDFIQLHKFKNVKQFSPIQKKAVTDSHPITYKWNHIMRGDAGDGIPNILSPDDTFISEQHQTQLRQTRVDEWINNLDNLRELMGDDIYRNFQRNQTLIDFEYIPEAIQKNIINTFNETKPAPRMKVLTYLINKRCNQLIECVEEFYNG
jgi:5'-3' exonuclease